MPSILDRMRSPSNLRQFGLPKHPRVYPNSTSRDSPIWIWNRQKDLLPQIKYNWTESKFTWGHFWCQFHTFSIFLYDCAFDFSVNSLTVLVFNLIISSPLSPTRQLCSVCPIPPRDLRVCINDILSDITIIVSSFRMRLGRPTKIHGMKVVGGKDLVS